VDSLEDHIKGFGALQPQIMSVFDHIARLTQGTPAHNAGDWRRRPGRPRARWTDKLRNDTGSVPANLWRQTGHPTGPWWSDATARAGYAMITTTTPRSGELAPPLFKDWSRGRRIRLSVLINVGRRHEKVAE